MKLKNSTVKDRREFFIQAYNVIRVEFGKMDSTARSIMDEYIFGREELKDVLKKEILYFSQMHKESERPINDNILGITDAEKLRAACSAIAVINIMEADAYENFELSYQWYMEMHKKIFENIFPNSGEERKENLSEKLQILNGRELSFMEHEEIERNIINLFEQIDTQCWDGMSLEQKCEICARIIGQLWYIHPFLHGNITMALYLTLRLSEKRNLIFSRKIIREQHEKIDLRKCILLASLLDGGEGNYLSTILLLSNNIEEKESTSKGASDSERKSIDYFIGEAKKERQKMYLIEKLLDQ